MPTRQVILKKMGVRVFSRSNISQCILKADKLIITIPPDNFGCKIINTYSKEIIDSSTFFSSIKILDSILNPGGTINLGVL